MKTVPLVVCRLASLRFRLDLRSEYRCFLRRLVTLCSVFTIVPDVTNMAVHGTAIV